MLITDEMIEAATKKWLHDNPRDKRIGWDYEADGSRS